MYHFLLFIAVKDVPKGSAETDNLDNRLKIIYLKMYKIHSYCDLFTFYFFLYKFEYIIFCVL